MTLWIEAGALERILAHARRAHPEECCGALFGRDGASGEARGEPSDEGYRGGGGEVLDEQRRGERSGRSVVRAVPAVNRATEARTRRYSIPAEDVRELESLAAAEGVELVGYYHSHPVGGAEPSREDLEAAWPWYSYLIVAGDGEVRSWRLDEDRRGFSEERIVTVETVR